MKGSVGERLNVSVWIASGKFSLAAGLLDTTQPATLQGLFLGRDGVSRSPCPESSKPGVFGEGSGLGWDLLLPSSLPLSLTHPSVGSAWSQRARQCWSRG